MLRSKFIANKFYEFPEIHIWDDGALWWNKEYNSGPWFWRKLVNRSDRYQWIMGVANVDAGGRLFGELTNEVKDKVMREFEPYNPEFHTYLSRWINKTSRTVAI